MIKIRNSFAILPFVLLLPGAAAAAEQPAVRAAVQPASQRKTAPNFRLQDANGKYTSLSKFRGRVVLMNFWATECGGCRTELPYFVEFDHAYKSKGLQTLGIAMEVIYQDLKSQEEGWVRVKPFLKDRKIEYRNLMADTAMSKALDIDSMPATYLIDRRGRIAAKYIGVVDKADVDANLKTLLAER